MTAYQDFGVVSGTYSKIEEKESKMFKVEQVATGTNSNKRKSNQDEGQISKRRQSIVQTYLDRKETVRLQAAQNRATKNTTELDVDIEKMRGPQLGHRGSHQETAYLEREVGRAEEPSP